MRDRVEDDAFDVADAQPFKALRSEIDLGHADGRPPQTSEGSVTRSQDLLRRRFDRLVDRVDRALCSLGGLRSMTQPVNRGDDESGRRRLDGEGVTALDLMTLRVRREAPLQPKVLAPLEHPQ
jgi:hypothetical protein